MSEPLADQIEGRLIFAKAAFNQLPELGDLALDNLDLDAGLLCESLNCSPDILKRGPIFLQDPYDGLRTRRGHN